MTDPFSEYQRRLAIRLSASNDLTARLDRLGQWRVGFFILGVAIATIGSLTERYSWWVGFAVIVPISILFVRGIKLDQLRHWESRIARYYEASLRRLDASWIGSGNAGTRFIDPEHLCAADLDLFGKGSLFERLCTARTGAGEERLANWLKQPATRDVILKRQESVADLKNRLDLREGIAASGVEVANGADFEALTLWGERKLTPPTYLKRRLIFILGWVNLFLCLGWLGLSLPGWVVGLTIIISLGVVSPHREWIQTVIFPVEEAAYELKLLASLLVRFESESFDSKPLKELQNRLLVNGKRASTQIRQLASQADWLESRRNAILIPFRIVFLWDARMAFAAEDWRLKAGGHIRDWIDATAELEALSSLAAYTYENPNDCFPTIAEGEPKLECEQIGHPLMPSGKCVRNDVTIDQTTRLLMISGSNMSGKSTLLRSVGVNAVLALAGAPVRAKSMTMTSLVVAGTLRVQDSLGDGRSRFFAEVVRVRAALDAAKRGPVLFLFDELFAGTNSADRIRGAAAVIHAFLDAGAIGLVTTHDLAVTELPASIGGMVRNMHFADQWVNGEMSFDHTMRPGVVPHSNGVALMRAVGLEV